jgi:homoserine O-acetyltransferase/O-succinyltransferase
MGGAIPGEGQARGSHRRDREEHPHDFLYTDALMEAITSAPGFQNGFYDSNEEVREGLARHAKIWAVMGFSTEFFKREHWRTLGFTSLEDFQIGFMEAYFDPMDPNDLLCMARKWQRGDVSRHTGEILPRSSDAYGRGPSSCRSTRTCYSRCATARRSRR